MIFSWPSYLTFLTFHQFKLLNDFEWPYRDFVSSFLTFWYLSPLKFLGNIHDKIIFPLVLRFLIPDIIRPYLTFSEWNFQKFFNFVTKPVAFLDIVLQCLSWPSNIFFDPFLYYVTLWPFIWPFMTLLYPFRPFLTFSFV